MFWCQLYDLLDILLVDLLYRLGQLLVNNLIHQHLELDFLPYRGKISLNLHWTPWPPWPMPCWSPCQPPWPPPQPYDSFSVEPIIWVRRGHESESGQMVLKKVKLTYFDAYLWQTMWNHAKKNQWKSQNFQIQCFDNGTSGALWWKRPKNTKTRETKTQLLSGGISF